MTQDQQAVELKPCPFCGSDAYPNKHFWDTVTCHKCAAEGPAGHAEAEAITAWNTRALEAVQQEAVDGRHVEALRYIKKTLPDYEGRAAMAVHYQRLHAALDAAIAAIATPSSEAELLNKALTALRELRAVVRGEAPSLLDEDSGGDAALDMEIDAILAKAGKAQS